MNWENYWIIVEKVGLRYFLTAGFAFLVFYILLPRFIKYKKIQERFPKINDYAREIGYSVFTIFIFALVPLFLIRNPVIGPFTTFYTDISSYSTFYFYAAFVIMLIVHDTYFYWIHRLMHHPKLFKIFHLIHHKSINPSPWAAYAFHPLEALLEVGIVVVFLFTIPIHKFHLFFFFIFMIVYNVYGHLGYEIYPKGFNKNRFGKWVNTSVNHNQHHQYFKGNYGLYFLFWDRIMGTIREDYDEQFDEIKNRKKQTEFSS